MANNMVAIRRDPLGYLQTLAATYGDVVGIKVGRLDVVLVVHPADVQAVLVTHAKNFARGRAIKRLAHLVGDSLLTTDGPGHLQERRVIQPVFQHRQVADYAAIVTRETAQMLTSWQDGQCIDLLPTMLDLTLRITGEALFGADLAGDTTTIRQALADAMQVFWNYATIPYGEFLLALPLPGARRYRQLRTQLQALVTRLIRERQVQPSASQDFLGLLLAAQDEDGTHLTPTQVRDEALTFLLAGHETVGVALCWAWYAVAQQPAVRATLTQELASVLGGRSPMGTDLSQLPYTRHVFQETLRLFPPLYGITRRAYTAQPLPSGYTIPAGAQVVVSPFLTQRDARWFLDPLVFRPERWATPDAERPRFAYSPFGGGPHVCIGEGLAWLMGTLILASIAQGWESTVAPDQLPQMHPLITLRPADQLPLVVHRRSCG